MSYTRPVLVLALLTLASNAASLAAGAEPVPGGPRVTEAQAKQRAAAAAEALGVSVWDASAVAVLHYPKWLVKCHGYVVTVRDDTGRVSDLSSEPTGRSLPKGPSTIDKDHVLTVARRVLKAVGAPADVRLESPRYEEPEGSPMWLIAMRRRTRTGLPYPNDMGYIALDAKGGLVNAEFHWSTAAPPANMEVKVTKAQAIAIAKRVMQTRRRPGSDDLYVGADLGVVEPNGEYAAPRPHDRHRGNLVRVAWCVSLPAPLPRTSGGPAPDQPRQTGRFTGPYTGWGGDVVWIDAADAKVLGGGYVRVENPPPAPVLRLVRARRRHRIIVMATASAAALLAILAAGLLVRARRRRKPVRVQPA